MDNHDSNTRKEDEYRDHVDAEYDEIHGKKNYRELYYGFSEKGKIYTRLILYPCISSPLILANVIYFLLLPGFLFTVLSD